jgi:hypothetical protein
MYYSAQGQSCREYKNIKRAPHWSSLIGFGGSLTIEEFRKNQTRDVEEPKQIETAPIVNITVPVAIDTKRMDEIKNASASNNALKLKRTKPLKRNHNNLESALGLIITPKS